MQAFGSHTLRLGGTVDVTHAPHEYLALVDVETYEPFISKEVDHLDMMAHLYAQMKKLTGMAWGAPPKTVTVRFFATDSDQMVDQLTFSHCDTTASGWIRTQGRLCLTSHDRLFDCARYRTHRLLREQKLEKAARPQVIEVPPGIYSVLVRYHFANPFGGAGHHAPVSHAKIHYSVILRHYPFPQPRPKPVRLPGFAMPKNLAPDAERQPAPVATGLDWRGGAWNHLAE